MHYEMEDLEIHFSVNYLWVERTVLQIILYIRKNLFKKKKEIEKKFFLFTQFPFMNTLNCGFN